MCSTQFFLSISDVYFCTLISSEFICVLIDKFEARDVVKFLHLQGTSAKVIHDKKNAVYGNKSSSYEMVPKCKHKFQTGNLMIVDDPRTERPSITEDATLSNKVKMMTLKDKMTIKVSWL